MGFLVDSESKPSFPDSGDFGPCKGQMDSYRGFPKRGCFPQFSGKVLIVSQTLLGMFLVGALPTLRESEDKEKSVKSPKTSGKSLPPKNGKVPKT